MRKIKERRLKQKCLGIGFLATLICCSTLPALNHFQHEIAQAAEGSNVEGNAGGVTWGGKYFSWKLVVTENGIKRPAYCINLGLKPTTGQEMKEKTTRFVQHPEFKRFVYAAHGVNMKGLQEKYHLTDDEAWKGSIYVAHVIENRLGYGPQIERLTENEFNLLALQEGKIGQYAIELLEYAKQGELPNSFAAVNSSDTKSHYNPKTKRLETGVYTMNDVDSNTVTVSGLSKEVYLIDAMTGEKISTLKKNQKFQIAADNLRYSEHLQSLSVKSNISEFVPVIWKFDGVQDLIQARQLESTESKKFEAKFQSVLGNVEFSKRSSETKKGLEGIEFNLLTKTGEVVATSKSDINGNVIFRNMLEGSYTIQEVAIAGDGLVDDTTQYPVNIVAEKSNFPKGTKIIENQETVTKIKKTDLTNGKCVENAQLQVIDKEGKVVADWISDCSKAQKIIHKLKEGDYILREVSAPSRYQITSEVKFSVKEDGTVQNVEMKDARTRLKIKKIDRITKEPLSGAKFGVYGLSGEIVKMLDKEGKEIDAICTSESDGSVLFEGLQAGTYIIKEIESPKGYTKGNNIHITVGQNGEGFYEYANEKEVKTESKQEEALPKTGGFVQSGQVEGLLISSFGIGKFIRKYLK